MSIDNYSANYSTLSSNVEYITSKGINICGLSNINNAYDMHYLIYKIININNGKYYIGQHKSSNPLDNYMGSGKYIERAIEKEGISAFIKIILKDYDNFEEMNQCEKDLVQLSSCFPENLNSYNLIEGGNGQLTDAIRKKISNTIKNNNSSKGENNPMYGYQWSAEQRKHQSDIMKGRKASDEYRKKCSQRLSGSGNPMFGKHHSSKTKEKISNTRKQRGISVGENNPMYGLKFMTDEQKIEWKQKISKANAGKKRTCEQKKQMSERAKALHIKRMHDPHTGKIVNVPQNKIQDFLNNGYIFGTGLKTQLGKTGACAGKRIMTAPDGSKKYIKIEDIQKYIQLGWKLSKRSKPI